MTRTLRRAAVATVMIGVLMGSGVLPALASPEGDLLSMVNSARRSAGKSKVTSLSKLKSAAESHARSMRDQQKIYNSSRIGDIYDGWKSMGQIVGAGPNANALFDAFMGSSKHKNTILGSYNYIGIGAASDDNGVLWVAMYFMNHPDDDLGGGGGSGTTTTSTTTTKPPRTTTTAAPTTTTTAAPATTTTSARPATSAPTTTEGPTDPADPESEAFGAITDEVSTTTSTTSTEAPATETSTTAVAAAPAANRGTPAGGEPLTAGAAGTGGLSLGSWVGFAAVALAALGTAALTARTRATARAGAPAAMVTSFEACTRCGIVYNQHSQHTCPGCGLATA